MLSLTLAFIDPNLFLSTQVISHVLIVLNRAFSLLKGDLVLDIGSEKVLRNEVDSVQNDELNLTVHESSLDESNLIENESSLIDYAFSTDSQQLSTAIGNIIEGDAGILSVGSMGQIGSFGENLFRNFSFDFSQFAVQSHGIIDITDYSIEDSYAGIDRPRALRIQDNNENLELVTSLSSLKKGKEPAAPPSATSSDIPIEEIIENIPSNQFEASTSKNDKVIDLTSFLLKPVLNWQELTFKVACAGFSFKTNKQKNSIKSLKETDDINSVNGVDFTDGNNNDDNPPNSYIETQTQSPLPSKYQLVDNNRIAFASLILILLGTSIYLVTNKIKKIDKS